MAAAATLTGRRAARARAADLVRQVGAAVAVETQAEARCAAKVQSTRQLERQVGLKRTTVGSRVFGVLKGAVDGGLHEAFLR